MAFEPREFDNDLLTLPVISDAVQQWRKKPVSQLNMYMCVYVATHVHISRILILSPSLGKKRTPECFNIKNLFSSMRTALNILFLAPNALIKKTVHATLG